MQILFGVWLPQRHKRTVICFLSIVLQFDFMHSTCQYKRLPNATFCSLLLLITPTAPTMDTKWHWWKALHLAKEFINYWLTKCFQTSWFVNRGTNRRVSGSQIWCLCQGCVISASGAHRERLAFTEIFLWMRRQNELNMVMNMWK